MSHESQAATTYLYTAANMSDYPHIGRAICDWVREAFAYDDEATFEDVLGFIYTIDCSACHAPPRLIYNTDIWAQVATWGKDIDQALWEFKDATGEDYKPRDGLTVGSLVWFAVEWVGNALGHRLEDHLEELIRVYRKADEDAE
jgi:hypothetical protein